MTFSNIMREQRPRTFGGRRMIGYVVANDDSQHPDKKRLQRMQIRLPEIHDDIKDADLPWFTPGGLPAYSGGSDVGHHGPIPPKNAKVYVRFEDDSQYHGQYLGGAAHVDNQIAEFVKPQGQQAQGGGGDGFSGGTDGAQGGSDNSDQGDASADSKNKTTYDFTKDYPQAHGHVDDSGNFFGHSTKADYTEHTLVSGTSTRSDGVGNVQHVINGSDAKHREGNENATKQLPEGYSAMVFGNGTVYISKDVALSIRGKAVIQVNGDATVASQGNATVQANGNATVSAKKDASLVAEGNAMVSSKKSIALNASEAIHLNAPQIKSQVPVVTGSSGSPSDAAKTDEVKAQDAPKARARPAAQAPADQVQY